MKIQRRKQFSPYATHCTRQQRRIFGSLLTILAFVAYTTTVWAPMVAQEHAWVGLRTIQRKKWISNSAQPFVRVPSVLFFIINSLQSSHIPSFRLFCVYRIPTASQVPLKILSSWQVIPSPYRGIWKMRIKMRMTGFCSTINDTEDCRKRL